MEVPHQQLSLQALADFRAIYQEEFQEELSDAQANEIALRLLQLFDVLLEQTSTIGFR